MRPFFLRIHPKGKRKQQPQRKESQEQAIKRGKAKKEDKPRTTKAKPQKIGEEDEKRKK